MLLYCYDFKSFPDLIWTYCVALDEPFLSLILWLPPLGNTIISNPISIKQYQYFWFEMEWDVIICSFCPLELSYSWTDPL